MFGGFVIRGRPITSLVDPVYAGYALRSLAVRTQMVARGQGAIHANIGQNDLATVFVAVPSIDEQRAIARALLNADESIAAQQALIEKMVDIRTAVSGEILSGRARLAGYEGDWTLTRLDRAFSILPSASNPRADLVDGGDIGYV
ncbi:MAG: hypothetical protein WEE66_06250 [Actinomycetota bacterium]